MVQKPEYVVQKYEYMVQKYEYVVQNNEYMVQKMNIWFRKKKSGLAGLMMSDASSGPTLVFLHLPAKQSINKANGMLLGFVVAVCTKKAMAIWLT